MKSPMPGKFSQVLVLLGLAAIFVFATPAVFPSQPTAFVDCDGDGFDDNAPDDDADAIPDELEYHSYITTPTGRLQATQMFSGSGTQVGSQVRLGCGEAFGRRRFTTRAVSENRLDFDAGFGSSLGLGGGLGAGGGCAGGVCF
jgi:hypothetical protein